MTCKCVTIRLASHARTADHTAPDAVVKSHSKLQPTIEFTRLSPGTDSGVYHVAVDGIVRGEGEVG